MLICEVFLDIRSAYQIINLIWIFNQLKILILLYAPQSESMIMAAMTTVAVTTVCMHLNIGFGHSILCF